MKLGKKIIKFLNEYVKGTWELNDNGLIDVQGDIRFKDIIMEKLPVKFGTVSGIFEIDNVGLKTLEGCPENVGYYFSCEGNYLKTLIGGPKYAKFYYCGGKGLKNLRGLPLIVERHVSIANRKASFVLNNLKYLPDCNYICYNSHRINKEEIMDLKLKDRLRFINDL